MDEVYLLTVDWCNKGQRGIFCDAEGHCFRKDDKPHTELEMQEILGLFWLILNSKSLVFNEQQVSEFSQWTPLAEYSNQFGIASRPGPGAGTGAQ